MSTKIQTNGIGFCGLLTIVFIALKLMKFIDWSWIWVLSPLWIPFIATIVIAGVIGLFIWILVAWKK